MDDDNAANLEIADRPIGGGAAAEPGCDGGTTPGVCS